MCLCSMYFHIILDRFVGLIFNVGSNCMIRKLPSENQHPIHELISCGKVHNLAKTYYHVDNLNKVYVSMSNKVVIELLPIFPIKLQENNTHLLGWPQKALL